LIAWLCALAAPATASPPALGVAATAPVVEVLDPGGTIDAAAMLR